MEKDRNGVVILNYNSYDLTVALVKQLVSYESIYKICVVDNNSNDDFSNAFNNVKVHYIKNKRNSGYNAGNNVGLRWLVDECECDCVFIANPDVDFENSAIKEMAEELHRDDKLVLISTKRFGFNGTPIHQYFDFPTLESSVKKCFFLTRHGFDRNNAMYQNQSIDESNGVYYVDAVPGAFFGIKSSFLKEINFLYEGIFLYGEELFIGRQAKNLGYKAGIINTSCYFHNHASISFSESNRKMFYRDRKSLIKYYQFFGLLTSADITKLKIAVYLGTFEYNCMSRLYHLLKRGNNNQIEKNKKCKHEAAGYMHAESFMSGFNAERSSVDPRLFIEYLADGNYDRFLKFGHAIPGHNGPHGHQDTPVRNTAHYLIIYSYLYKIKGDAKYKLICNIFFEYLLKMEEESSSGAIECMATDKFDHLNGLIGQAWVIEGLIYYYECFNEKKALDIASKIFYSQKYDWNLHLWHRIELDGRDIGVDVTCNHQVMFAACSYKLALYCGDARVDSIIRDFILNSCRDFSIYGDGILKHNVNVNNLQTRKATRNKILKRLLSPLKIVDSKTFDFKYIERAYHIFDMYCFSILKEHYSDLPIFTSEKYKKAVRCALDLDFYNKNNGAYDYLKKGKAFNVYSYSYNSPSFEYPYLAYIEGEFDEKKFEDCMKIQRKLMWDKEFGQFIKNNPDLETWNAKSYEIIRYLDIIGN